MAAGGGVHHRLQAGLIPPMTTGEGARGEASGKVILLGEHAVVHGVPAIAVGIPGGATAFVREAIDGRSLLEVHGPPPGPSERELQDMQRAWEAILESCGSRSALRGVVELRIPPRAGLGSSAAMAVALCRAVHSLLGSSPDITGLVRDASAWERVFHGNPSGIDVSAAVLGGAIRFDRASGARSLPIGCALPLCIGVSGRRAPTRTMVELFAAHLQARGATAAQVLGSFGALVERAACALSDGDLEALGAAMNDNHEMLASMGVSTGALDALCEEARAVGALGVKLSGAGGGGSVIALAPGREAEVLRVWRRRGVAAMAVTVGPGR